MRSILPFLTFSAIASSASGAPDSRVSWRWDPGTIGLNCTLVQILQANGTPVNAAQYVGGGDPSWSVEFKVRSPRFVRNTYEDGWIELANGERLEADFAIYSAENRRYRVVATTEDARFLEAFGKATVVAFNHPQFGEFKASVRDGAAAVEALQECGDALLTRWGIEPRSYYALRSRPEPMGELSRFFSPADYPAARARMGMISNVVAKLDIGADGLVRSCSANGNHKVEDFVRLVCDKLKVKARFEPARDSNGKTVAAPYVVVVRFVLA